MLSWDDECIFSAKNLSYNNLSYSNKANTFKNHKRVPTLYTHQPGLDLLSLQLKMQLDGFSKLLEIHGMAETEIVPKMGPVNLTVQHVVSRLWERGGKENLNMLNMCTSCGASS